jgi:hypothetical protein
MMSQSEMPSAFFFPNSCYVPTGVPVMMAGVVHPFSSLQPEVKRSPDAESVLGKVWRMSQDPEGCYDVQRTLEACTDKARVAIAEELKGSVFEAACHPHANYVVQKCIETLRPQAGQFIIDELMQGNCAQELALHKIGCRIIQRILEHYCDYQVFQVADRLLADALMLIRHRYGCYFVQHVLEYGCNAHKRHVIDVLVEHTAVLCSEDGPCTVMNKVLQFGSDEDRKALASAIVKDGGLVKMARSRFGYIGVRTVLDLLEEGSKEHQLALSQLLARKDRLKVTRYGRSVLSACYVYVNRGATQSP